MTPDALAALHRAAFGDAHGWRAADFEELLPQPGTFLITAPGGFALGRAIAGEAELLTICTDPAQRRQGIAAHVLQGFAAKARDLGAREAFLEVAEDNAPARALYARDGWREVARRKGYYRREGAVAADALILRRGL